MRIAGMFWLVMFVCGAEGAEFAGTWRGASVCAAKGTACHDETVMYRITGAGQDLFSVSADKIVDGKPVNMGTLEFRLRDGELRCESAQGVWVLKSDGANLAGTLMRPDGSLFRRVTLKRDAKQIVLIAGDQEYRSEEALPALAKVLETHHGFKCTVLYSTNKQTGAIDSATMDNIPGLEALRSADLMILFARFLELPDSQMKEIVDYAEAGRPIVGLRTATHPFNYKNHRDSPYARYSWDSKDFEGGFGRQIMGETWVKHWGQHQKQSTRGVPAPGMEQHPILKGVKGIWGPSDVYAITKLTGDSQPILMGQVLNGMTADAAPDTSKSMMPIAWVKTYKGARIFDTTMGHAGDFENEGFRRMVVNACYWALGMEAQISETRSVALVGEYQPHAIGNK